MKTIISLEEAAKLILSYCLSIAIGFQWWVFLVWLLAPDISMIGYVLNTRTGAALYNFFHHQALAIAAGLAGLYMQMPDLQLAGLVLFGHSAMDRMLGYGLKYPDHFKHTHLGWMGTNHNRE